MQIGDGANDNSMSTDKAGRKLSDISEVGMIKDRYN